jgi:hypothetical protein
MTAQKKGNLIMESTEPLFFSWRQDSMFPWMGCNDKPLPLLKEAGPTNTFFFFFGMQKQQCKARERKE